MNLNATALLAVIALASACAPNGAPPPPTAKEATKTLPSPVAPPAPLPSKEELVHGPLPDGPQANLARASCTICHSEDYLVQQRLTPEQWKKTVAKMQKFGAPVTDEQAAPLVAWLSSMYTPDLPDRTRVAVAAPDATLR